ncbi:MAG: L,D-transpeptidase family protein [Bacteroidetes bacterium]|nr:L,D-transpeptidase family protein [Bacteroidota bacterium]
MRNILYAAAIVIAASLLGSCRPPEGSGADEEEQSDRSGRIVIDSNMVVQFFTAHAALQKYENTAIAVYRRNNNIGFWFDSAGVIEVSGSLYSKVIALEEEGINASFPYQEELDGLFIEEVENTLSPEETDMMLTAAFLFYADKVVKGVDKRSTDAMGWLLPRKKVSFSALLRSFMAEPSLLQKDERSLLSQYYKLRTMLQRYREFERDSSWSSINFDPKGKGFEPGDSSQTILQIRERLVLTGDLKRNNGSRIYDAELSAGMKRYRSRNGFAPEHSITVKHMKNMNIPLAKRIATIMVNMERCRWVSPEIAEAKEYIVVNIPSYTLNGFRGGKSVFESPVVVGSSMTKTAVFSGLMSYVVFSPYWNIPKSIMSRDILPGIAADSNYLQVHDMEWINGRVRQRPGKNNSLGLVKFMFPNSKDIYLHDTPAKDLFQKERRAFSHGCVRVARPKELAEFILENDTAWTAEKIAAAMLAGVESKVNLKKKIPVHIGYFTAWVNEREELCFYEDIYKRDNRLARLIMN